MTKEEAIRRINKLKAIDVSRGASEAEALFAMEKISELLQEFNLSMDECQIREDKSTQDTVNTGQAKRTVMDSILASIADFTDIIAYSVKTTRWTGKKLQPDNFEYVFFGKEQDVLMAKHLYHIINRALIYETEKFKLSPKYKFFDGHRRVASSSFEKGFAGRICTRLRKMKEEMTANQNQSTNSLVVLKKQIVQQEFAELDLDLRAGPKVKRASDMDAYVAGANSANNVNLQRPIENDESVVLIGG